MSIFQASHNNRFTRRINLTISASALHYCGWLIILIDHFLCKRMNTYAGMIAGGWLKYWIEVGAVLSTIGLYSATLSSAAFQLLGMADLGLLPRAFALRAPVFDTPWVGILATAAITLAMSFTSFDTIVASANFLYSLGMLLEFAAFVRLRARLPAMPRPYAVPLRGLPAAAALCAVPSAFLVFVMAIAGWKVYAISAVFTAASVAVYYLMDLCKARGWLTFSAAAADRGGSGGDAMMYRRQGSTASEVV